MRFQVPQFIEVEDKVVGPLTFKQFIYVAGGIGLSFIIYSFLPKLFAIPLILVVMALSAALAFYKINNKPFINMVESSFRYFISSRLYIWKKGERKPSPEKKEVGDPVGLQTPKLSESKLKDLAWSLDVEQDR